MTNVLDGKSYLPCNISTPMDSFTETSNRKTCSCPSSPLNRRRNNKIVCSTLPRRHRQPNTPHHPTSSNSLTLVSQEKSDLDHRTRHTFLHDGIELPKSSCARKSTAHPSISGRWAPWPLK